jgi:CRP-like cAMP-binding protein
MDSLIRVIAPHPFFAGLSDEVLELVAGCASNVRFEPGTFLFRKGDAADGFFLVRHGRVDLEIDAPGRGPLVIETIEEDEVFGYGWLFPPYQRSYDAHARTLVRAVHMDGECLRRKCDEDPAFGYDMVRRFARVMMNQLESTRLRLLDVYGKGH